MDIATGAVLIVAGMYLVITAQLTSAKNVSSGLVFKALPTLIGIACFIAALKVLGWI